MDTCDNCGSEMRFKRLSERSPSKLYVCQECREWGMKRLGREDVTSLHVGFAKKDKVPCLGSN